ncbi:MAG: response regulator [Nitrospiraceae bacterium]|nr:response regulator [Nitrospiraceae bacterium]
MTDTTISKTPKVLFVDDEENVVRALRRLCVDEDVEILTALSGAEGLEVVRQNPDLSLIVSDQRMPGMNGWEFLEKAGEVAPEALRIILTGYADVGAAINAINRGGAYRYITKPWNDDDFLMLIRDSVEKVRLIAENRCLTELTRKQNEELERWNTQLQVMVQEQTVDIQGKNKELEKLNEQLRRNFRSSIEAFTALIEMRERSVSSHSKNVASCARLIAVGMSLPENEVSDIIVSSLLHDIGKIGVSDAVLMKEEAQLSESERKEYQLHAVRGQVAVESIEGFRDIGVIIRHHHEHVDGTGYPDGLKRNAIPLGSRVIAIADAVDKITGSDPLSPASYEKAARDIEFYLDTRFDRAVFGVAAAILKKKAEDLSGQPKEPEVEVHPTRLLTGMVLSRDIRSGTGLLILARDVVLDGKIIAGLQRYYKIDPPKTGIFVRRSSIGKPQ